MGLVLSLFPAKVHISSRFGRLPGPVLRSETLVTCPSLDQGPVHREMFIRHERPGSFQHPLEKRLRDLFVAKSIKGSKVWLITQTIFAWLCALFFGYKTLAMLVPNASLQQKFQNPNPGDP